MTNRETDQRCRVPGTTSGRRVHFVAMGVLLSCSANGLAPDQAESGAASIVTATSLPDEASVDLEPDPQPIAPTEPLDEPSGSESSTPASPSVALRQFQSRCGSGALTPMGQRHLARGPYLQQLSVDSTELIIKLSPDASGEPLVFVSTPDGVPVVSVASRIDPSSPDGLQRLAHVAGLQPSTYYCYSVGDLTERAGFRTAPSRGAGATVRFAALGDSGDDGAAQAAVRDQLNAAPFDLLLHTGDIAYEAGTLEQFERNFFDVYAPLLKSIPAFPVPGNHEYGTDRAAPFLEVFNLPDNGVSGQGERWYSFDWGDVHFVGLDTEQLNDDQSEWLERDLSANRRPWVVAYLHRPPYSSGIHGGSASVEAAFVPAFERHHVPLVLTGHDHNYERTLPINGVTYVVTGGGGKSSRTVGSSWFTAYSESVMHFVSVEVHWQTLVLRAIDSTGREFDSVQVSR